MSLVQRILRLIAGFTLTEVPMGGRFGKYGDAKRKAQIRKNRLRPPIAQQRKKGETVEDVRRRKQQRRVERGES